MSQQGSGASSPISCTGNLSAAPNLSEGALNNLLSVYPPGDLNTALHGNFGVGPLNNAGSNNYLLEGTLPGIAYQSDIVSHNTNPAESGCNTDGITYYYDPPQGSAQYTAWTKVLDPFAEFTSNGQSNDATDSFNFSGSIVPAPGYTATVTEKDSETFTFGT